MKKVFKFIVIFELTALVLAMFFMPTSVNADSYTEEAQEQLNLNEYDSLTATPFAAANSVQPVSVKVTGKDAAAGTVIYDTVTKTELETNPTMPVANSFIFNDIPYKVKAYDLEIEFQNKDLISSIAAKQNSTTISTGSFLDGSVELLFTTSTATVQDVIQLTITPTSGSKQIYYIYVNRLAASDNNKLGTISIVAHNGEESLEICNSATSSLSTSGKLTINYPNDESGLPFRFKDFSIEATPESELSTVEIKINNIVQSSYTFDSKTYTSQSVNVSIKVQPEVGAARTYTGTVRKAAPDQNYEFEITDATYTYLDPNGNEQEGSFDLEIVTLTDIEGNTTSVFISNPNSLLPFTATSASFKVIPASPTTKVYINGEDYTNIIFTIPIVNSKSHLTERLNLLMKSEYDELVRPGNTTSAGLSYSVDISSSKPDTKRKLTDIQILHSVNGDVESNDENTISYEFTYSFELKKSILGEVFKLDLSWESAYAKAYLSTTNSPSIRKEENLYDPNKVWNIGTDIYLYLQSQDEEYTVYTISTSFADERSTENGIEDVILSYASANISFTFDEDQQSYPLTGSFKVPFSVLSIQAEITLKHEMETLKSGEDYITGDLNSDLKVIQSISLEEGVNTFKLQAVSEKDTEGKEYTFVIEREAGQEENDLENLIINGIDCTDADQIGTYFDFVFDSEDQQFSFYAPRGTNSFSLNFDIPSQATFTINSLARSSSTLPYEFTVNDGEMTEISIQVKSEVETIRGEGEGKTYNIKVYVADKAHVLDDLHIYVSKDDLTDILDINGNSLYFDGNLDMGTFVIPFKAKSVYFLPVANDFPGKIKIGTETLDSLSDGLVKELSVGDNIIEINVLSELEALSEDDEKLNDNSVTYTLNVVRSEGSHNADLKSLTVEIDGEAVTFTDNGTDISFNRNVLGPYPIEYVLETAETINIIAEASDENATISGDKTHDINLSFDTINQTFRVTVTAEDEVTTKEYEIELWTTRVDPDDDNSILAITATTDASRYDTWNTTNQKTHTLKLFLNESSARFLFFRGAETSKLYVEVDGEEQEIESDDTQNVYVISLNTGEEKIYKFYCVAEDHSKGDVCTLTISRAADNDASLATLTYNGTTVPGFTAGMDAMFPFEVLIGDLDEVTIAATPTKSTTTISTLHNPYSLNPGDNYIVVETTAQDGITQYHYIINVIKDADKVLDDIESIIEDEEAEVNVLTPEFDPSTYTGYSVELDYEFDSLLIRYASDLNTALLVLPDNSTIEAENKSFTIENIEVGTNLYKIRVRTASGATEDYEISITRNEPDTDATLMELTYNGTAVPDFTAGMESDEFEIFIKAEEEVYFAAVPTKTTTSVDNTYDSSNPASLSIGENSFTITTLAQDGETSCTYVVKVIKDAPLTLDSLEVIVDTDSRITDFDSESYHYAVDLAYSEQAATIVYSTSYADYNTICFIDAEGNEIDNATTTLTLENIEVGTVTYKIRITGYSGEYAEYEVTLTRDPGSDDNTILSFKYKVNEEDTELTELNINATDTQYSYLVGRDMVIFDPTIVLSDSKASYEMPVDTTLICGQGNIKEIVVTSENGKERVYTFTVYPCDTEYEVDLISLLTSSDGTNVLGIDGVSYIDFGNNVLTLIVPNAVDSAYLNVEGGGINSEIYVNGTHFNPSMVSLEEGQNTFEIYIKSEYAIVNPVATDAQSQVYTLNIERVVDPTITIKTTGKNGGDTTEDEVIPYGSDKTYDIAENGYTVLSFKIDGVAQEIVDSYDFTNITSNHVIEIEYEPLTYTITVSVTAGQGGVYIGEEKIESAITYTFGQEFVFTFIPDEGYRLKGINVDGVAFPITSTTLTAGREGDHAFAVSFELIKYQVTLSVIGGHGKITPETATEIGHGFSQSYTFVPDEGYQVKEVKIDDVSYGILPSYTLSNVKANHRISVEFEIKKYTIDVTGNLTNGTVLPGTSLEYEHGNSATYTFTPDQGYHIALLSIDGTVIEGLALENVIQDGYTFDNITSEHTIVVNFEINTYTITVTQTINGTISEAQEYYEYGTDATFTITPLEGCKIVQLIVDGNPVDASNTYTFESISQDHTFSAIFKGEDSSYKVYHHFQNLDGGTYADAVLVSEEQALVNDVIKYLVPTFAGFTAQPVGELTVQPNHVSEIHVYFDRLSYILSFGDTTGTTSILGAGTYFYGQEVTVSADILTGYRWAGFISNDETLLPSSEDNPYTFNMPAGNVEFSLNLTPYFIIEIQPTKYGILSIAAGSHEFDAGEDLTITYEPYTGYKIKDIKIDGRSLITYDEESYTFSNIRANHTFFIEFEQIMFNINTSIIGNGNASFDQVQRIPYGSRHVFTIVPQNGYEIINVSIDGQAMGPIEEYIFDEILEDHEIEIQIQQIIFRIRVNVIGNGTINPSGDAYVTYGSDKILTFTPDIGYYVKNVKIDNRDLGELSNYIFETVTNDHQVEVEFEQITYTIIHNTPEHGSILPNENLTLPYGSNQTISFVPDEGYVIKEVKINGTSVGNPTNYSFLNLQSNQEVEVEFEQIYFTIDTSVTGQGKLIPTEGVSIPYGSNQTFVITPDEGHYISRLEIDGKVIDIVESYTFENVREHHTILVEFEQITFTIEVNIIGDGTINLPSNSQVVYGESRDIEITAKRGCRIKSIRLNGQNRAISSFFTLSDIKEDYLIEVEFEIIEFTITVRKIGNGTASPNRTHTIDYGMSETISFTPDFGYKIKEVLVDGESIGTPTEYTFENITADHFVTVEFEEFLHKITVLCGEHGSSNLEVETIVSHDSNLTCRFTPDEGFTIQNILVDGLSVGSHISAYYLSNISSDHIIEAFFTEIVYNLTMYVGANGTVTYPAQNRVILPDEKIAVFAGSDFSLNVIPNENYKASIRINGEKTEPQLEITLTDIQMDYNIIVEFILMLDLEITSEGKGSVPKSSSYEWLTPVTLVFTPEVGNKVKEVQIDGKSVGTIDNYFFPELTKDHTVHVIFEPIIYSIHSTIHGEGVIEGSKDLNNIEYGEDCVITITPEEGWQLAIVFVNGEITEVIDNQITIKDIEGNVGVVAYFTEVPVQSIPMWLLYLLAIIILILIILLIIASIISGKRKRKLTRLKH